MRTLTSVPTLVEAPFIIVKIGDYTFGQVQKTKRDNVLNVTVPEYVKSVSVVKVNGEVNTYEIQLEYPITKGNDPNLIDYVFSSVSSTRKLTISYGDWNSPSFIYKEEETLITNVKSSLDFNSPKITYNISCVSDAKGLQSVNFNFPTRFVQPSSLLFEMLRNPTYKLTDIFTGMADINKVKQYGLIAGGDKVVRIPAKVNCNVWEYLNYVVGFMVPDGTPDSAIATNSFYRLSVIDDNKNELNGSYFTVTKVATDNNIVIDPEITNSVVDMGAYEVDLGYPTNNFVTNFQLNSDEEWSILYNTATSVDVKNYSYKITNTGELVRNFSPSLTRVSGIEGTTAADKSWWSAVTSFPIQATLTLKGLVRPTILMSYIKLNVVFYGQKHISSGYYVIEKQTDQINENGYKTTLNLLRVKGDVLSENEVTVRNNKTDPATGYNLATNKGNSTDYKLNKNFISQTSELFSTINPNYNLTKVKSTRSKDLLKYTKYTGDNSSELVNDGTKQNSSHTSKRSGIQTGNMTNDVVDKNTGFPR